MKEFKAESKKLLDLVVNSIYTNREIFLRELISNSSDAIDKRRFQSLTDGSLDADFSIEITIDKAARTLTISDNGIGMTEAELEDNLGVIAKSGTETFRKENDKDGKSELIGYFGVGFYSAFMVAENVTVISKRAGSDEAFKWESDGASGFEITKDNRDGAGTTVILKIKPDGDEDYSCFLNEAHVKSLVKKYSDYIRYPIRMVMTKKPVSDDGVEVGELTVLNSMTPVWKKQKSEVSDGELNEFYKSAFRDYRDPLLFIQSRVEGAVDYTALLFVPSEPAFDYYTKDYKRGLTLYCNGALVMDRCAELIPEYLSFIRGVVDTPDLNLNISRETLQQDRRVRAIATSLEKKIISEFEKLLKTDREKYVKLFNAFGKAIKFGAYDNFGANKDKLKDVLLYYSDAQKKEITLKEYCEKLEKNAVVMYACGETSDKVSMLPQLEGARSAGKDVLYFTDPVDEFIAKMLGEYDGHKFENIASSAATTGTSEKSSELLTRMEKSLGGKASVCATDKLNSYPVCLGAKGDVSLEMERVMDALGGGIKAERVLQVNLEHPVIKALDTTGGERFEDTVTVLYNEALLAEGYKTEPDFISALNRLLGKLGAADKDEKAAADASTDKPKKASSGKSTTAKKKPSATTKSKSTAATKSPEQKRDGE